MACLFPITAFVASGFKHSVANMYLILTGLLLADKLGTFPAGLTWGSFFFDDLLPVTLGKILGGGVFVAFAYWFVHLRRATDDT